jgi:hypothetical protein
MMGLAGKTYISNTYMRFIKGLQGLCSETIDINEDI